MILAFKSYIFLDVIYFWGVMISGYLSLAIISPTHEDGLWRRQKHGGDLVYVWKHPPIHCGIPKHTFSVSPQHHWVVCVFGGVWVRGVCV